MAREAIGALWLNEGQGGKKYMSGRITVGGVEHRVVIFKNDFKQPGEKSPDYKVYPQQDRGAAPASATAPSAQQDEDSVPF